MDLPTRFILENRAWAEEVERRDPGFFEQLASGQQPGIFWIGCSDSRVPAERITNATPGDLFVHRSIANLVLHDDNSLMSALQYAIEHLNVAHVIVCGHDGCGGVRAALMPEDAAANDEGNPLAERIRPLRALYRQHRHEVDGADARTVEGLARCVDRLVTLNGAAQVRSLAGTAVVRKAWQRGQALQLHGWVYGLRDGRLREVLKLDAQASALPHAA